LHTAAKFERVIRKGGGWPQQDIFSTNCVWCMAYKGGVVGGGAYIAPSSYKQDYNNEGNAVWDVGVEYRGGGYVAPPIVRYAASTTVYCVCRRRALQSTTRRALSIGGGYVAPPIVCYAAST